MAANLRFGLSSISMIAGHDFASTDDAASRDLRSLITLWMESIIRDFETSTIILTVGRVVMRFCACGGRITTGTAPMYKQP